MKEFKALDSLGWVLFCWKKVGELFDLGDGVKAKAPSQTGVAGHDCNCRCFLEYNLLTVEEFEKATGQTMAEVRKKYNITNKNVVKNEEIKYNDIERGTTKLKSAMSESDYADFMNLLSNNDNIDIKKIYSRYGNGLSGIVCKPGGGLYNPGNNTLEFGYDTGLNYNEIHKFSTLAHEYGHYFDAKVNYEGMHFKELETIYSKTKWGSQRLRKTASSSDEFLAAVRKDREFLKTTLTDEIKEEFREHHASLGVQDAIDGLLAERIVWGHGDAYYNRQYHILKQLKDHKGLQAAYNELGIDASNLVKTAQECRIYESASEMWANIMSAETCSGNELEYIKKYLPNSYRTLLKIIGKVE